MKHFTTPNQRKRIYKNVEYDMVNYAIVFDGDGDLIAAFDEDNKEVEDIEILGRLEDVLCDNFNEWVREYETDVKDGE
jgi:phosphomannomutase